MTIACISDHTNRIKKSGKICQFYAVLLIALVHQLQKLAWDQNSLRSVRLSDPVYRLRHCSSARRSTAVGWKAEGARLTLTLPCCVVACMHSSLLLVALLFQAGVPPFPLFSLRHAASSPDAIRFASWRLRREQRQQPQ